jgi:hypothetical protein
VGGWVRVRYVHILTHSPSLPHTQDFHTFPNENISVASKIERTEDIQFDSGMIEQVLFLLKEISVVQIEK